MKRLVTMITMMLATTVVMLIPTAPASAASFHARNEYCVVRLAPLQRNQVPSPTKHVFSRVMSRACSDQPTRVGFVQAGTSVRVRMGTSVTTEYPIINVYQDQGLTGDYLQFQGPLTCTNSGGYGIQDAFPSDHGKPWGTQSWLAQSGCWHTTIFYGSDYGNPSYTYAQGVYKANVIGAPWNQHVGSIITRYE